MRRITAATLLACLMAPTVTMAQQKSLASTLNVYVFPTQGQSSSQQSEDEASCFQWAQQNTGVNPFALQNQEQQQQAQAAQQQQKIQQAGAGAGAAGAVGGAAAGALIGGITGHSASAAAGYGAAAGFLFARRRAKEKQQQASQQASQQSQQATQATGEQMANFKKAFSCCLKAKNYMVEY
jgi:hypothetical protein